MDIDKSTAAYQDFLWMVEWFQEAYARTGDPQELVSGIWRVSCDKRCHPYVDQLLMLGNSYIESGDTAAGIACMQAVKKFFPRFNNETLYHLRMAQYHIENGDEASGRACLLTLCRRVGNYEESIEVNGLTPLWEKYKHLVQGLVAPSGRVMTSRTKTKAECDTRIHDILALPDEDILNELSTHLQELTGNGEVIQALNKWERTAYYVDELCMEVNSGGFEGYLYYHGTHFEKAYKALEQMGAGQMTALLDRVREKFPRNRIPKTLDSIQNTMDRMEEKGVDFEAEDDCYYGGTERELLERLTAYVRENAKHFR